MTLGLGSVVSSAVTAAPWLVVISRHKNAAFLASGLLLAFNYWLVIVRPRQCVPGEVCHVDHPAMRWNRRMFWLSVGIFAVAALLTFGTLPLLDGL